MSLHLLRSEREDKIRSKYFMVREDCGHTGFAYMVGKNLKTPNKSSMADEAITQGGTGVWDL